MSPSSKPAACRVCGCTENNACEGGCWWAKNEPGSPPLCSACEGTADDMAEAIRRGQTFLKKLTKPDIAQSIAIGKAALRRRNARNKLPF